MAEQLDKVYDPQTVEKQVNTLWGARPYFHPDPSNVADAESYTIVIPPPNVTAALHLGHALNNTLQDVLIRFRRMQQRRTLWMPGTDHAGIATQTVVEKRILAEEGKRRTDFARDDFVARVQAWKDEYETTIIGQLKAMGCSCDWARTRFTMDEVCAKAVRANFFNLFRDGLIYRGKRLVNWDPATQTVLADDEVEHETVRGHFWYLRYPLVESVAGVPPLRSDRVAGILPACQNDESTIQKRQGRYLPHWSQEGATYAISFRLADAVPAEVAELWRRQREEIAERARQQGRSLTAAELTELDRLYSEKIESFLDAGHGNCLLRDPQLAQIVQSALRHFDGQRYQLVAWAVMPNHVHAIVRPLAGQELPKIVHSWKSFTSKEINRQIGRQGSLWMDEYYDHLIRDERDFGNQVEYVLANPEKAGLRDWPWYGMRNPSTEEDRGQDALGTRGRDALDTIRYVTVATTRPETMLGDTAVAMNPNDPRAKYLVGKHVRLPIVGRIIPIVADEHVVLPNPESEDEKARFSTGFLKVTPAHDPDDWAIGQRHNLDVINVMAPDGSISDKHGWVDATEPEAQNLLGMDRFEAREAIVEWFRQEGLLEDVREYTHEVGHSYRSHVPIEPYLSDQWYIAVKKPIEHLAARFGDGLIEGTGVPVNSLAGLALKPLLDGRLRFIPERYARTYQTWLENLRDWPISRQLWWGHRIPVWSKPGDDVALPNGLADSVFSVAGQSDEGPVTFVCVAPDHGDVESRLEVEGWSRDSDVLDTWFSSALWPFSTLGWPDETPEMKTFYPGDVLCTAREIITLWVSRMVMMGQYCAGDIPFRDVYIHAMIQDGEGRKMSKSLGNGIDPLVAIDSHGADAMRFTLASMTTDTQDIRMPVAPMTLPDGRQVNTSPKFDIGRNFCNKLWNASRFAMMNLDGFAPTPFDTDDLDVISRWILSRLAATEAEATAALEAFKFSEPLALLYRFFWNDFCDWYLEWVKFSMRDETRRPIAQNVLAFVLDRTLRLLHPFVPFITEGIYQKLNELAPARGLGSIAAGDGSEALTVAQWPRGLDGLVNADVEEQIRLVQETIRAIRDIRNKYNKSSEVLAASAAAPQATTEVLNANADLICQLANLTSFQAAEGAAKPNNAATTIVEGTQVFVHDVIDPAAERARLDKQKQEIQQAKKAVEGKLANENFVSRAKPEVVAQARERLTQLQEQLQAVETHLTELGG
ncbi:valine--tRNA ligase [Anaerobaca lacustris]|uniref:Valine--tRNA ligase n=1 Tax=Anaerobaca lacustris TaxID=3044600 RepID=A0AAW6U2C9_9BACT|nr:valine--tRNA ligase [Sedimentisphaerales bacterium M17dextr]